VILRNLLRNKEELTEQKNTTKLLKMILFSQSLQTQLSSHSKGLNSENLTSSSDDEGDQEKDKRSFPVDEAQLIALVSSWFKVVNLILNKEKPTSGNNQPYLEMQEAIKVALKATFKYFGSDNLARSAFANNK
jgi:hypothetical protein